MKTTISVSLIVSMVLTLFAGSSFGGCIEKSLNRAYFQIVSIEEKISDISNECGNGLRFEATISGRNKVDEYFPWVIAWWKRHNFHIQQNAPINIYTCDFNGNCDYHPDWTWRDLKVGMHVVVDYEKLVLFDDAGRPVLDSHGKKQYYRRSPFIYIVPPPQEE